jgi:hypothetical protein
MLIVNGVETYEAKLEEPDLLLLAVIFNLTTLQFRIWGVYSGSVNGTKIRVS